MPEFLGSPDPISTHDTYVDALTLGPASNVSRLNFSNLGDEAVIVQFWKPVPDQPDKYNLEQFERFVPPQAIGGAAVGAAGIRFRSANIGKPSLVTAEMAFKTDIQVSGTGVSASSISAGGTVNPIIVTGGGLETPTVTPVYVADPGAGVSSIVLYTVPAATLTTFKAVSYRVLWDASGGLGDRAILYEIVDPNGGGPGVPAVFMYAQSGNTIYVEGDVLTTWLETDIGTMGNFLRTRVTSISEIPFNGPADFEQASAPFGDVQWPEGFFLRLTVPHMAASDEVDTIRLLVSEVSA